jgi:hypothetical protein
MNRIRQDLMESIDFMTEKARTNSTLSPYRLGKYILFLIHYIITLYSSYTTPHFS